MLKHNFLDRQMSSTNTHGNASFKCIEPNCKICSISPSSSYKSKKLLGLQNSQIFMPSYNTYTLNLVIDLISRKCTDMEFLELEKVRWSTPQYVYITSVQLMDDNPIRKVLKNGVDGDREKFEKYYAINFASMLVDILQKTFVKNLETQTTKVQEEHKIIVRKFNIFLHNNAGNILNTLSKKYIDLAATKEIISIQYKMDT